MSDNSSPSTTAVAQSASGSIRDYIKLMRPAHWLKNAFIFAPLVYGKALTDAHRDVLAVIALFAFCLVSSCIYILNDIADRRADAEHPKKRNRPIASGRVSVTAAIVQMVILAAVAVALITQLPWQAAALIMTYAVLNLGYSFGLKHVVLLDVFIIAAGFMLRVLTGAKAVSVDVSQWLIICTLFLSLFLAIAKRRSELNNVKRGASRKVLDDYTPELIRIILTVSVAGSIMSYTLYTVSEHAREYFHTDKFVYTVPIVMYGIFRYLYLDEKQSTAENPVSVILRDPSLIATGVLWMLVSIYIIYSAA
jgi:4-hydroxybenzoate polyprenyltransferase